MKGSRWEYLKSYEPWGYSPGKAVEMTHTVYHLIIDGQAKKAKPSSAATRGLSIGDTGNYEADRSENKKVNSEMAGRNDENRTPETPFVYTSASLAAPLPLSLFRSLDFLFICIKSFHSLIEFQTLRRVCAIDRRPRKPPHQRQIIVSFVHSHMSSWHH